MSTATAEDPNTCQACGATGTTKLVAVPSRNEPRWSMRWEFECQDCGVSRYYDAHEMEDMRQHGLFERGTQ